MKLPFSQESSRVKDLFGQFETPRGECENTFTPILRALWSSHPAIVAVVFTDQEGEWIDYCSAEPAFETKVMGAHMILALGSKNQWVYARCLQRDFLAMRVGQDYALSAMLEPTWELSVIVASFQTCAKALAHEIGMK